MSDRIDEAIDRAVREMLDVEPPADLRARVLAQLPASGSRLPAPASRLPAFGFRLPASGWVLGPVAAVAIVVLAVLVARRSEPLPQTTGVAVDRHLPLEAGPAVRTPGTGPRTGSEPVAVAVTRPSRVAASYDGTIAAANVPNHGETTAIAPLNALAPIAIAPIAQESIAPADIAFRPLASIAEVQISPLTPPDGR